MFIQVTRSVFRDEFAKYEREDNFSYEGLNALFDYLDEFEEVVGSFELDVIALCYDFAEYDSMEEIQEDFGLDSEEEADEMIVAEVDNGSYIVNVNF